MGGRTEREREGQRERERRSIVPATFCAEARDGFCLNLWSHGRRVVCDWLGVI